MTGLSFGNNTAPADSWPRTVPLASAKQPAATSQIFRDAFMRAMLARLFLFGNRDLRERRNLPRPAIVQPPSAPRPQFFVALFFNLRFDLLPRLARVGLDDLEDAVVVQTLPGQRFRQSQQPARRGFVPWQKVPHVNARLLRDDQQPFSIGTELGGLSVTAWERIGDQLS